MAIAKGGPCPVDRSRAARRSGASRGPQTARGSPLLDIPSNGEASMPRITRSRALARLVAKWPDHRLHQPGSIHTLPLSKLLTGENIAATAVLNLCAAFDDEIEERHRRPMRAAELVGGAAIVQQWPAEFNNDEDLRILRRDRRKRQMRHRAGVLPVVSAARTYVTRFY